MSSLQYNKPKDGYIENLILFRSFREGNSPPTADPKTTQTSKKKEFQPSTVISIGTNDKLEGPNISDRLVELSEDTYPSLNSRYKTKGSTHKVSFDCKNCSGYTVNIFKKKKMPGGKKRNHFQRPQRTQFLIQPALKKNKGLYFINN